MYEKVENCKYLVVLVNETTERSKEITEHNRWGKKHREATDLSESEILILLYRQTKTRISKAATRSVVKCVAVVMCLTDNSKNKL